MNLARSIVPAIALASTAGTALAQADYELHIIPALSTFGIPEAYLNDLNENGTAVGVMTYTRQLPSGSFSTSYQGFEWTVASGASVDLNALGFAAINNNGDKLGEGFIRMADGSTIVVPEVSGDLSNTTLTINDNLTVAGSSVLSIRSGCRYSREAFYWTPGSGSVGLDSQVGITSADVVESVNQHDQLVGYTSLSGACADAKAFYYDIASGEHIDLNFLLNGGAIGSNANDINENGVVVGDGATGTGQRGWRWQQGDGFTFFEGLTPATAASAIPASINNHGVSVGKSFNGSATIATMWSPEGIATDLNTLVSPPDGFVLDRATAINDRGDIVGVGHYSPGSFPPVAFYLEALGIACRADFDGDGELTIFDFLAFQNAFDAGDLAADFDEDGSLTIFDFLAFQNEFDAGC